MLIKLLFILYLTSSYLGAIHIHHDALKVVDCKVHILVKNLNSGDNPKMLFTLLDAFPCPEVIPFYMSAPIHALTKGFQAQAPPFFF